MSREEAEIWVRGLAEDYILAHGVTVEELERVRSKTEHAIAALRE